MTLVQLLKIRKDYGEKRVLDGLDFEVEENARIELFGARGSGKSTLLRLMTGTEVADSGNVRTRRGARVSHLPRWVEGDGRSALETVRESRPDLQYLEDEHSRCARAAGSPESADAESAQLAFERQEELLRRFRESGGPEFEGEARSRLSHLAGLDRGEMSLSTRELDEERRKLVALAACLARRPDLLLLEEPQAHLGPERREILEAEIHGFEGAIVLVSCDRIFLERLTERALEVRDGRVFPDAEGSGVRNEGSSNVVSLASRRKSG